MALAAGVSRARISELVTPPFDAVTDQAAFDRTVDEIRAGLAARPRELLPVTAEVLGVGYETLREHLLVGLYRWGGRKRAVPVKHSGTVGIAAPKLGLTDETYLRLGGFASTASTFSRENLAARRQPKKLTNCDVVREVVIRRHHGASSDEIIGRIERQGIKWVALPKQIPEFLAQHARLCKPCRPGVAYDLHHTSEMAVPKIADMLDIAARTAADDVQRGNDFIHQWESRLRIWPDRGLQTKPPEKPV